MAKLPPIQRILSESFPEVKWIATLLAPINSYFEAVTRALNNELTISENMNGVVQTVDVAGVFPQKFKWPRASAPTIAWLAYCRRIDADHTPLTVPVSLDWEYDGQGNFKINALPGLDFTGGKRFRIRIIAQTG